MHKNSRQRDAIRKALMNCSSHPSAETVYQMLKETYPNISLGTVYRNLNFLTEAGEITKVPGTVGSDRFDGNTSKHIHFFCTSCDAIIDLHHVKEDDVMDDYAQNHFGGKICGHITNFFGICPSCLSDNLEK